MTTQSKKSWAAGLSAGGVAILTGGIVTDWKSTVEDWDRMGFPIAEVARDEPFYDFARQDRLCGV